MRLQRKVQPLCKAIIIICIIVVTALSIRYLTFNTINKRGLNKLSVTSKTDLKTATINALTNVEVKTLPVKLDYVVVHLDFKGMPPKLSYLTSLLATLKRNGVNGLLMEYEDSFPYEGTLADLSAAHHYKKDELKTFLQVATTSGFEIIPLIQTFGQMQFALKHEKFQDLRENSEINDTICPSQKGSLELIKEILTQVIGFHQSIAPLKHVHIGCSGVSAINQCNFCAEQKLNHANIFMNHVVTVAGMVKSLAPEATSLVWWDMILPMSNSLGNNAQRYNNIEIVYWSYFAKVNMPLHLLHNIYEKFENAWIASAFKGVDEPNSNLPNIIQRVFNTFSWMRNIVDYNSKKTNKRNNFKGIFLTGLSKRDHFDISNLLVPSIPSLLMDLTIINQFKNEVIDDYVDYSKAMSDVANYMKIELHCDRDIDFSNDLTTCKFEGHELYNATYRYDEMIKRIYGGVRDLTSYIRGKQNKISNTVKLKLQDLQAWCKVVQNEIGESTYVLKSSMAPYYEETLIEEYIKNISSEANLTIYFCDMSSW